MSPFTTCQIQKSASEVRILTPMEAILDSSFGALICPTCDGLFTHESYLESHYLSEDNDCIKPIPSLYERISDHISFYYGSVKNIIKTRIGQNGSSQSSLRDIKYDNKMVYAKESPIEVQDNIRLPIIERFMSLTWKFIMLILFLYILCNVSVVHKIINGDSEVDCME